MCQPRPEVIARAIQKNLRLIFQPPKRSGMNDPRTIALEFRTVSMAEFREFPASRIAGFLRTPRQNSAFVGFHLFPGLPSRIRDYRAGRIVYHSPNYSSLFWLCESGVGTIQKDWFY